MNRPSRTSVLCPNCRRLVSADETRCPHCGERRPGSRLKNNFLTRYLGQSDQLVRTIIIANVAMFFLSLFLNARMPGLSMNPFHVLSPENRSLLFLGATGTIPIDRFGRLWTLVSAMYLHGGLLHILFNMLAFSQLAPLVIREYGGYRAISIYTLGGIAGFWISYRAGVTFTIGASCAVCALIGALLYYGLSRGGLYGQALFKQIGAWAVGIMLFGFMVPGINNWAHGGGVLAGAALGFFMGYQERRIEGRFDRVLGYGCVGLTLVILAFAAASGIYYRLQIGA